MTNPAPNPVPRAPSLLDAVHRVCLEVLSVARPELHPTVYSVIAGLGEPLRLAIAGRVKAGKSTLVNALVGRMVAPTRAGECTKVVTWYRYGAPDRAEIVRRDGVRVPLPFSGSLPEELGMPTEQIDHLEVHLQSGALRSMTLIDTPGLATTTVENEAGTRRALLGEGIASVQATSQADAVLYVFRDAERQHEVDFLRDMQDSFGTLGASAATVAGLLSHADLFGKDPWTGQDTFVIAAEQARRLAVERSAELGAVVPVAGLLAQTARTGQLRESDARLLAQLASIDALTLQLAEFVGPPEGVDAAQLAELVAKLGPYGVSAGRAHAVAGSAELLGWLREVSGIDVVEELIHRQFLRRAQALKADHALTVIERAVGAGPDRAAVLGVIETARQSPALHGIRQLRALGLLMQSAPDSTLRPELVHLIDAASDAEVLNAPPAVLPSQLVRAAREAGARAQARAGFATSPAESEAARVLARSYLLLARRQEAVAASSAPAQPIFDPRWGPR